MSDGTYSARLLGGAQLQHAGHNLTGRRPEASITLLACLLAAEGADVDRRTLAGTLFPDVPTDRRLGRLRLAVHYLGLLLGDGSDAAAALKITRSTLAVPTDRWSVDAWQFQSVVDDVVDAPAGRLPPALVDTAQAADQLYRGELLPGIHAGPIDAWRARLHEGAVSLARRLAAHHAAVRQWRQAVHWAERMFALDPYGDAAIETLMRAHVAADDDEAALAAFERFRERLFDETGDDPAPALVDLAQSIRDGRPIAGAGAAAEPAGRLHTAGGLDRLDTPSPTGAAPPNRAGVFVGRAWERSAIGQLLRTTRIVTLVGPGGVGKTRLAVELLHELEGTYPDGAFFVDLGAVGHEQHILGQVAKSLGVKESPGQSLADGVRTRLTAAQALLVFDNCEHVVQAAAQAASLVTSASPGARVLATSRTRLAVQGERVWKLAALTLPPVPEATADHEPDALLAAETVQLFCARLPHLATDDLSPADRIAIANICHHVEGLPLGIEIAAAFQPVLGLQSLWEHLGRVALSISDGSRSRSKRQSSLRATIDWSYSLLAPEAQATYRRLGVFAGEFALSRAGQVLGPKDEDEVDVRRRIAELVEVSLVSVEVDAHGHAHHRLLRIIRDHARWRLAQDDEEDKWFGRHASVYLRLARRAARGMAGPAVAAWQARLEREHVDLVGAIEWASTHRQRRTALAIASRLWRYWYSVGRPSEGLQLLQPLVRSMPMRLPAAEQAEARMAIGVMQFAEGSYPVAVESFSTALASYREADDAAGQGVCLTYLCRTLANAADYARSASFGNEAVQVLTNLGDARFLAAAHQALGDAAARQGHLPRARAHFRTALRLGKAHRDRRIVASAFSGLGTVELREADLATARRRFEAARRILAALADRSRMPALTYMMAMCALSEGQLDVAEAGFEESLTLYRAQGNAAGILHTLHNLGDVAWARGDLAAAEARYAAAMDQPTLGDQMRAWLHFRLAESRLASGDEAAGADHARKAMAIAREHGIDDVVAECWRVMAQIAAGRSDHDVAAQHIAASLRLWHEHGGFDGALRAMDGWCYVRMAAGDVAAAITMLTAVDHQRAKRGAKRPAPEEQLVRRVRDLASSTLGPDELAACRRQGHDFDLDTMWRTVRGAGTGEREPAVAPARSASA